MREGRRSENDHRVCERTDDCPEAIFLADVVGASTERFFTADRQTARIHQITEELPAYSGFLRSGHWKIEPPYLLVPRNILGLWP